MHFRLEMQRKSPSSYPGMMRIAQGRTEIKASSIFSELSILLKQAFKNPAPWPFICLVDESSINNIRQTRTSRFHIQAHIHLLIRNFWRESNSSLYILRYNLRYSLRYSRHYSRHYNLRYNLRYSRHYSRCYSLHDSRHYNLHYSRAFYTVVYTVYMYYTVMLISIQLDGCTTLTTQLHM